MRNFRTSPDESSPKSAFYRVHSWNVNCPNICMKWKKRLCTLDLSDVPSVPQATAVRPADRNRKRLEASHACLEMLSSGELRDQDPEIKRMLEERIIWRELLELELHDIDEEIERIVAIAGDRSIRWAVEPYQGENYV